MGSHGAGARPEARANLLRTLKLAFPTFSKGRDFRWAADDAAGGSADQEQTQAQAAWKRLRSDETEALRSKPAGMDGIGATPAGGGPLGTTSDAISGVTGDPAGGAPCGATGAS